MFPALPAKFDFPAAERAVLAFWDRERVFERSLEQRRAQGAPRFVFYEGPPTANGLPHPGHCLTRAIKDIFPRYQTMRGKLVERKAGWDTHGLPVEVEVCKELGIHTKEEIEAYGVEKFNLKCIQSVFRYTREWEEMTRRLGFWVNLDEAYVTFHQSYVESVWWGLKQLFDRGLLYQGHKVVWWWCQGGTALSAGEVGEGYRAVDDPSVYVRFPILGAAGSAGIPPAIQGSAGIPPANQGSAGIPPANQGSAGILPAIQGSAGILPAIQHDAEYRVNAPHENRDLVPADAHVSLLVWTTTPWTLISNHFAAVHADLDYALIQDSGDGAHPPEYLYVAAALVESLSKKAKRELKVVKTCKGSDLIGLRYEPPFDSFSNRVVTELVPPDTLGHFQNSRAGTMMELGVKRNSDRSCNDFYGWRVVAAGFVTLDSGSGIVHVAPAFGQDDSELLAAETSRHAGYGFVNPLCAVAPNGNFNDFAPQQYRGRWVKDCDKEIIRELKDRGLLFHQEVYRHDYPFCPRAENDPLIQYARKSWFVRTSQFKSEFLTNNDKVHWLPEHIKEGRFGDFLRNNVDWALSRERYWGTPLPIWECTRCGEQEAVSSFAELRSKKEATDGGYWDRKVAEHRGEEFPEHLRIHKPYIDEWTYPHNCTSIFIKSTWDRGPALMRRVPEVIDCWWDAGSMPFAQWGYPHKKGSDETFACRFPADFISEAIDQTRGWFYGLLSISTLLFGPASAVSRGAGPGSTVPGGAVAGSAVPGGAGPGDTIPGGIVGGSAVAGSAVPGGAVAGGAGPGSACPGGGATALPAGSAGVPPAIPSGGTARRTIGPQLEQRQRYRLPHWEAGGATYLITFNLAAGELSPEERTIVMDACRHFDPERLLLHAAVVMPDHVHLLLTPQEKAREQWWPLADLMHSIKSFSAKEINRCRGMVGEVWQAEYFDRLIRSASDFDEKWRYIVDNPARWGLPDSYPWVWVESPGDPSRAVLEDPNCGRDARTPPAGDTGDCGRDARTPLGGGRGDCGRDARNPRHGITSEFPLPFRNCIVLGHMMGEDGLKMSKRKKNYKEPSYIFDSLGADAMRWYFFSAQAPWTTTRFVEASIRDAQRDFLVRLYNVFSFFNIYANIDGFEIGLEDRQDRAPVGTGWREVGRRAELDRWIVSELHRTIAFVRQKLDAFENFPAAQRLNDFVDGLSNWYLRRSRDRFWRALQQGPADQDKWDAYNTLHEVLLALSQLIAPFTPFFAEVMYQHLVGRWEHANARAADQFLSFPRSHVASFPLSVHLCDYPSADPSQVDEDLAGEMDLVRDIVSSGRAARTEAKLKVRQPLGRVEIILARHEHQGWLLSHAPLIAEELNVKTVEFATSADRYVQYQIKANFKALGPRFGKLAPQIAAALNKIDVPQAREQLAVSGQLALQVAGEDVRLTPDEVEIRLEAKSGWAAAQSRAGVVVLSTELTPELREEGVARELVHHVQALRKELELAYEQRIKLQIDGPVEFTGIVQRFADVLKSECLADRIDFGPPAAANSQSIEIEGHAVTLAVVPVR